MLYINEIKKIKKNDKKMKNRNVNMLDLGCYGNIKIMKKKIINILDYELECYIKWLFYV